MMYKFRYQEAKMLLELSCKRGLVARGVKTVSELTTKGNRRMSE